MESVKFEDNVCYVKSGKKWKPRSNFGMTFINHVLGNGDSGWIVRVTRASDRVSGLTHFRMADLGNAYKLQTALNTGFLGGGLLCYFKGEEMFQLNNKLDEEMRQQDNVTRHLLSTAGYQTDEGLYFLNPEQVINVRNGELVDHDTLPMVWIPDWPGSKMPREELFHQIHLPISIAPFQRLLDEAKNKLHNNFAPALLAWSSMLMMFRYRWILRFIRHFNLPMLYGPPSVGKTLVAQCGAWLCGAQETQVASRCTKSFLTKWLTTSTMPFVWDDPSDPEEVGQLAVELGNGAVRGKSTEQPQLPTTGCMVTANFDLSAVTRYHTRMCILKMNVVDGPRTPGTGRALEQLADEASCALPLLLRGLWEMVPDDIDRSMADLQSRMSLELRVLEGLSVPVAVARKVLQTADREDMLGDIQSYLDTTLLPYLAECLPSGNSIADIIVQKALNHPLQIPANVDIKEDEIRIVRAFLTDTVKVSEATLQKVTKERLGSSSKPTRFQRGPLKRCTVLNISAVTEEIVFRLRRALDGNVDENEAPSASDEEPEPLPPRLIQPLQPLQPADDEGSDNSAADRSPSRSPSPRPRLRRRQVSRSSRKLRKTRR